MRSTRGNIGNPNRARDPANGYGTGDVKTDNYQLSSSEDEGELSQLKHNLHHKKRHHQLISSNINEANKKSHKIIGGGELSGNGPNVNSHNFLLGAGPSEDATSPNESENAYAEASLLPSMGSGNLNRQDMRYNQGMPKFNFNAVINSKLIYQTALTEHLGVSTIR